MKRNLLQLSFVCMCKYESFSCSKMTDQESLSCSICLDLFKSPVIIPCGDTYCKDCITGLWEQCDHFGFFRCPQCKQTFSHRPRLIKCVVVRELCEKLRKTRPQTLRDVSCDSCTTRRVKAVKSCLTCLLSFCDSHVEQHQDLHGGSKHQLVDATDLPSKTCSQHGKLLEFYCRTDQQCICVLCGMNDHKNHDTISAADEREEKQSSLMKIQEKFLQKIQDREEDFKELTKAEESVKHSAQTTAAESERIFSEVVSSIQETSARIKEVISDKERAELSRIQELQEKVQQEMAGMKMKVSELDQLMPTEDHIQFLQNSSSHYEEPTSERMQEVSSVSLNANVLLHDVMMMVSRAQERWMDVNKETEAKISSNDFADETVDAPETVKPSAAPTFAFLSHSTECNDEPDKHKETCSPSAEKSSSFQCGKEDVFCFGESIAEFNFSFPCVAPCKPFSNPSQTSQRMNKKEQNVPHCEPLHDRVEISTGEENEHVVFSHRAKLYRFDDETSQWKERGVGDLKILQNYESKCVRLVMRRDKVLKLCANHWITSNTTLKPMNGTEKAWSWNALDCADGDIKSEMLAVRFKLSETANAFKDIFEKAKDAKAKKKLLNPLKI